MGVCFSRKKKKDSEVKENSKSVEDSRDPLLSELPQEEEKVKEVLSETPKLAALRSNIDEIVKRSIISKGNDDEEKEESEVNWDAKTAAPSQSTTTTTTVAFTDLSKDEDEEEGEMVEKKKTKMRSTVPKSTSQSPAKTSHKRTNSGSSDLPAAAAAKKREMRAVDVGCRTARSSSPSPLKNRSISSKRDVGERSGRRLASPAINNSNNNNKMMRAFATEAATMRGRSTPQRQRRVSTARAVDLGEPSFGGQNGNNAPPSAEAEDSLENPLVSLECFIFL